MLKSPGEIRGFAVVSVNAAVMRSRHNLQNRGGFFSAAPCSGASAR